MGLQWGFQERMTMTGGSQEKRIRLHRYSVLSLVRGEHRLTITVTGPSVKPSKRSSGRRTGTLLTNIGRETLPCRPTSRSFLVPYGGGALPISELKLFLNLQEHWGISVLHQTCRSAVLLQGNSRSVVAVFLYIMRHRRATRYQSTGYSFKQSCNARTGYRPRGGVFPTS